MNCSWFSRGQSNARVCRLLLLVVTLLVPASVRLWRLAVVAYLVEFDPQHAPVVWAPVRDAERTAAVENVLLETGVRMVRSFLPASIFAGSRDYSGMGATHYGVAQRVQVAKGHPELAGGRQVQDVDAG